MKKYVTQFVLLIGYLILNINELEATHIVGAELTYTWVSGNTYRFRLHLYRDCGSTIFLPPQQKLFFNAFTCSPIQDSIVLTQVGPSYDVSPLCTGIPSTCNGGVNPGIEKVEYEGFRNLGRKCRDWLIYFRECNRAADIQTIVNPAAQCLYVEARLNNLDFAGNSSPRFNNDPVSFLCLNQQVSLNPGITEIDGDVLRYKLVLPRTNLALPNQPNVNVVQYIPPYSHLNPIPTTNGFMFDSTNGTAAFTPSAAIRSIWAQRIDEYRNGVFVGSITRDMQILVRDCFNNTPQLTGFNNSGNFEQVICLGDSATFTISANDDDAADSVFIRWNNGISGAIFKQDSGKGTATATISWKPSAADLGTKTIVITVNDNGCPFKAFTSRAFNLHVRPKPQVKLPKDTTIPCGVTVPVTATVVSGLAPYFFTWSNGGNAQTVQAGHGKLWVRLTDQTSCQNTDTMEIKGSSVFASISTDTNCKNRPTRFKPNVVTTNPDLTFTYLWEIFHNDDSVVIFTSTQASPVFTFNVAGEYLAKCLIKSSDNCEITVFRKFEICDIPRNNATFTEVVCEGQPINIGCARRNLKVICDANSVNVSLFGTGFTANPTTGVVVLPADSLIPDTNIFNITVVSNAGCTSSVNYRVIINPAPDLFIGQQTVVYNCDNPNVIVPVKVFKQSKHATLSISGRVKIGDSTYTYGPTLEDTLYFNVLVNEPGVIPVEALMSTGCKKSGTINVIRPIQASIRSDLYCNKEDSTNIFKTTASRWGVKSYHWLLPDGSQSTDTALRILFPPNNFYTIRLVTLDSSNCLDTVTHIINAFLPDTSGITVIDTVCNKGFVKLNYPNQFLLDSIHWFTADTILRRKIPAFTDSLAFDKPGINTVNVRIMYKGKCTKSWPVGNLWVRNPVRTALTLDNICAYDTTYFEAFKTAGDFPVSQYTWRHQYLAQPGIVFTDTGEKVKRLFNTNGRMRTTLTLTDAKNCTGIYQKDTLMVLVSKPGFDVSGDCQKDSLIFFTGRVPDIYENIDRYIYDYGDGGLEASSNGQGLHLYQLPGVYRIILTGFSRQGCSNRDTTYLTIKPRPTAVIDNGPPEICVNQAFSLDGRNSKPSADDETITRYEWTQNGNFLSNNVVAEYIYTEAGLQYYALQVRSTNGCKDYLRVPIQVHPTPTANFSVDPFDLLDKDKVRFLNQSTDAVWWHWRFGDGLEFITDRIREASPEHRYEKGEQYDVWLSVRNKYNCADSIMKVVNMRAYIALPSAFTPNRDQTNDLFRPVHRLIKELNEFKIYNRLGQEVFAGKSTADGWDGSFNGIEQPPGVYVYVLRARSVYNEELILKGKMTLVR
jgi:gliding motility-associated-like protein